MNDQPAISQQLRLWIKYNGVSQAQLCRWTGISQSTMSRFMRRKGELSMSNIDKVAYTLRLVLFVKLPPSGEIMSLEERAQMLSEP